MTLKLRNLLCLVGSLAIVVAVSAATPGPYTPARYRGGSGPANQLAAVGGGEVFLQLDLNASGGIAGIAPLRVTPPFTQPVVATVRGWTFSPAVQDMLPEPGEVPQTVARTLVASKVFVAAMFRAPVLSGPTIGAQPTDVGSAPDDMAFPTSTTMPVYPTNARMDATVVVEVHVGPTGSVLGSRVVQSTPAFDGPAIDAIGAWSFRPARVSGMLVDSYAYVSFAFRAPVGPPAKSGLGALSPSF